MWVSIGNPDSTTSDHTSDVSTCTSARVTASLQEVEQESTSGMS